jgi:hypothetical protein
MFAMSVNDVPGWSVTMPPSAIGVPVALSPGLLPHCDVLTVAVLGVDLPVLPVLLLELLHPAAMSTPVAAARMTASRVAETCSRVLTYPHLPWW